MADLEKQLAASLAEDEGGDATQDRRDDVRRGASGPSKRGRR